MKLIKTYQIHQSLLNNQILSINPKSEFNFKSKPFKFLAKLKFPGLLKEDQNIKQNYYYIPLSID